MASTHRTTRRNRKSTTKQRKQAAALAAQYQAINAITEFMSREEHELDRTYRLRLSTLSERTGVSYNSLLNRAVKMYLEGRSALDWAGKKRVFAAGL